MEGKYVVGVVELTADVFVASVIHDCNVYFAYKKRKSVLTMENKSGDSDVV